MGMENLEKLWLHELKDLYNAEQQILKALPKMAEKASHADLRSAFEEHHRQTQGQVERLERIFSDLGEKPGGVKCKGAEGIIEEGEEMLKEDMDEDVRDAALIAAAQRVEHYEIAAYGTVRTYAERLGRSDAAQLLQETLDEESATDEKLTRLATAGVNQDAMR